jgi:hypothetical protein
MDYVALNMKVDGDWIRIWNVTVLAYLQELPWLIKTTKISQPGQPLVRDLCQVLFE